MKLDHSRTPYTKINSKWMKDLDVRQESIKIMEENIGSNRHRPQQLLSWHVSKGKGNKRKNELLGHHQDKKLLHSKGNSHQNKDATHRWEKIFANETTDKKLVSKIYKELLKLNTRETNKWIQKWAEDMNRYFSNEDIQMANRHMKKCSKSLAIRRLGGTAVKRLPLAQGVIPVLWDRAPHQAPLLWACFFLSHSPACVPSLAGCLYLCQINK